MPPRKNFVGVVFVATKEKPQNHAKVYHKKKKKQNTNSEQKTGNMIRLCICIKRKISNTKSLEDTLFVKGMML